MRRRYERAIIQVEYPTYSDGVPINPYELDPNMFTMRKDTLEKVNNHHFNFCARTFGSLAIAQTFRDLNVMQAEMRVNQHDMLHRMYSGIPIPALDAMMEIIEEEKDREPYDNQDRALKIYNKDLKRYEYFDITDSKFSLLKDEYDRKIDLYGHKKPLNL